MVLIVVLIFAAIWSAALLSKALSPVRVGVLLPVEANANLVEPLAWAAENINREGGINGRPLELVYADTSGGDLRQPARDLLRNPDITFVIGPFTTDEAFEVAPLFIERKKVLISPSSTGGDLIRAFGKTGYF